MLVHNPLLPWAWHVAHAWGVSVMFFVSQPCMVDVIGWEVWARREGLLVINGSHMAMPWVAHKAGSLVFYSIVWDQGGKYVITSCSARVDVVSTI
ncbi:hypothetical protein GUJ93_ZPchr0006g46311 [Zizania palustris]|uniref:Uncharacterized protein n=1 Tax=Zizania palustris TaxID=103762 RepID=A0A8J5TD71_ZIZPA|nr:hypothetical protein GUJ93_ZPchr0006g46311 [Zizania palustris]